MTKFTPCNSRGDRISFVEATTDITRSTKSITTQGTTANIALENVKIIQTAENFEYHAENPRGDKQGQNNSSQMVCDEYHQLLLNKSILHPEIAERILHYVERKDLKNTAQFVVSFKYAIQ